MPRIRAPLHCKECGRFAGASKAVYERDSRAVFVRIGWLFLPCKHVWLDKLDAPTEKQFDNFDQS